MPSPLVRYLGERRALALAALGFVASIYTFLALLGAGPWTRAIGAVAACYTIAFLAVAAEWFWGRWFAIGIGWSGLATSVLSMFQVGVIAPLVISTVLHAFVLGGLAGQAASARYDGRADWRDRLGLDTDGAERLGKAVRRAAMSLPTLLVMALAPRDGDAALLALVGAGAGLWALLRGRTWGLVALAGAGLGFVASVGGRLFLAAGSSGLVPLVAGLALLASAGAFGDAAIRFLRRRS